MIDIKVETWLLHIKAKVWNACLLNLRPQHRYSSLINMLSFFITTKTFVFGWQPQICVTHKSCMCRFLCCSHFVFYNVTRLWLRSGWVYLYLPLPSPRIPHLLWLVCSHTPEPASFTMYLICLVMFSGFSKLHFHREYRRKLCTCAAASSIYAKLG